MVSKVTNSSKIKPWHPKTEAAECCELFFFLLLSFPMVSKVTNSNIFCVIKFIFLMKV